MGSTPSKLEIPHLPEGFTEKSLPQRISVASQKSSLKGLTLQLSGGPGGAAPSYAVRLPNGYYGSMILHGGSDIQDTPMANVQPHGKWRQDFLITLPGLGAEDPHDEVLRYIGVLGKKERYWFGMEVGQGSEKRAERFEWRRSHGEEVKSLGEHSWGWKLVAVGTEAAEGGSSTDKNTRRNGGTDSQGDKVVAVFADAKIRRLSLRHIGEFEFRNAGLKGELGIQWSIMALLSCLCIWQKEVQTGISAASAS